VADKEVLGLLQPIYGALLFAGYLFVSTREATVMQLFVTLALVAIVPGLFFALVAVSVNCVGKPRVKKIFADGLRIFAVSVPVDYWDYLGWKDTLADPHNTARQKAYAHARGDGQVYTPQVVVNGSLHALGSDKAAIELAIAASRKNGAMSLLPTLALTDGRLTVSVPDAADFHTGAEVWLFGLSRSATVAIGRGENKGRAITYHNVVRRWVKLGDWTGKANSWSIPVQTLKAANIDEAAVLVQSGTVEKPKTILGATLAAIH